MPQDLPGGFAPPGVYTQTFFGAPPQVPGVPPLVPLYIGTGSEILVQSNLPVARGSSATVDQQIVNEDESGRAVVSIAPSGLITLGAFNGELNRFQVRNFPLVTGDGTGTVATDTSAVSVTLNGDPVVVLGLDGTTGIIEISEYPTATDVVLVTYFFDRTDTQVTDDVSAQVSLTDAILNGRVGQNFTFGADSNLFKLTVDGLPEVTVSLPVTTTTASVVAATINGTAGIGSLVASTFVNNLAQTCVRLSADKSIVVGSGSANEVIGFVANDATSRNATFYVFNRPIVNGNGGGVTSTNPLDVRVLVDSVQVTPTAVNGRVGAVTLPFAPAVGSTVTIEYFFNSWQDTFDYLANTGVTSILRAGITTSSNGAGLFIQGSDYILKNDTIVWGTASLVNTGLHTEGSTAFGSTQVTASLVDNQAFMAECSRVTVTSGTVATSSRTQFQLPFQPTTGNGRNSPLGTTNYLIVANGRMDLPTDQPDLVTAYWGFGVQDAYDRGPVTVTKVDSSTSTITLAGDVPEGATVYATFYYNTLVDQAFIGSSRGYTLTCVSSGTSGAGTYQITNGLNVPLNGVSYLGKGAALNTIEVMFPSGSEFLSDARLEGGTPTLETVVVEFASTDETPAKFSFPGAGPYSTISGASSNLRVTIDGVAGTTGAAGGITLTTPTGSTRAGAFASLLGDEVPYTADSDATTYDLVSGVNDTVSLLVDGVSITASTGTIPGATALDFVNAINTAAVAGGAASPYFDTAGTFPTGVEITVSEYDQFIFRYTGDNTGSTGNLAATLTPGTYTAATLATEVGAQFTALIGGLGPGYLGLAVAVSATASSGLRFTLTKAGVDGSGYLEFVTHPTPAQDFCVIAGLSTDDASKDGTKLYVGPIASLYTVTTVASRNPYDRIVLRNRIFPGAFSIAPFHALSQCSLQSQGGNGAALAGLTSGMSGEAAYTGCALGPTIVGDTGWAGQIGPAAFGDARDGQPAVTFYDGTDPLYPANNVFKLTVNGTLITVVFTATPTGTLTAIGPSIAGSVIRAMNIAFGSAPGTVTALQEGAKIRIYATGALNLSDSAALIVGDGNANNTLGFTSGEVATVTPASAKKVASALMSHIAAADLVPWLLDPTVSSLGYFSGKALASTVTSATGGEYLYLQSKTLGSASSFLFATATTNDALRTGTGLGAVAGDGSSGEASRNGFFVTSSDPASGSGSANTSVFNSGVGQDGFVGQTYVDDVTGLTFTVLPREGGLSYPTGATSTLTFRVSPTLVTDANIPTLAIPGLELTVANTVGVPVGDTALVETFARGGSEPGIGEVYYVTYNYLKTDYSPKLFSRLSDVVNEYGAVTPDNPLSLVAYFAFLNGATVIGCQQVPKTPGLSTASEAAYQAAIDLSAGPSLPGFVSPAVLVALTPATVNLARYMAIHCDVQSSIRYKAERTAIFGFASGTRVDQALAIARAAGDTRVRFVYPDIASVSLTNVLGVSRNYLVDGRYLAGAVAAATTAPTIDPATPWESRQIIGFSSLNRRLDAVTANQLAVGGVTVLENRPPFIRIRHGVTSDVTNILTKTPTVIQIADEIQKRIRAVCSPFIGAKFLPQILGQIEGRLSEMFKQAQAEQIITTFTGITVTVDPTDPTAILVEAFYQPVWPLLYIQVTLRVSAQ
jgi:hypothetical protein